MRAPAARPTLAGGADRPEGQDVTSENAQGDTPPARKRIVVRGVVAADPPYRVVEIDGQVVGTARDLIDVLKIAHQSGIAHVDVDDPASVRWVGGGKYHWSA